ncbi:flagellar hook capping FlgD N-terminal domain-containing protein [Mariprofundus sp. KV]|uniref:flagellar hook assembly protein FlgD n=1 Tax=Mariprofundus sp. KV TaxID=2608715 RepID=UPI0015A1863D|nr:flagellar hook capping FlgD N-terminal domain-containing protein [Mariprofundus sp. KV]NWF37308.1 flagellar hook capping protein [Mariprofundus sp. KV]
MALTATDASTINTNAYKAPASNSDIGQKDIFLKLLVAQMKFQDPMKPQDATAMSQQLAQFNMVEQQTTTNKLLEQLVGAGGTGGKGVGGSADGASYLGHTVTMNQSFIEFNGTSQNFNVQMDANAPDGLVFIYDADGNPVRTMQGSLNAGANPLVWDGLTDSGATAPQGTYLIGVSALDLNGNEVTATVQRTGVVEAVRFSASGTSLVVNGVPVSITDISELRI